MLGLNKKKNSICIALYILLYIWQRGENRHDGKRAIDCDLRNRGNLTPVIINEMAPDTSQASLNYAPGSFN